MSPDERYLVTGGTNGVGWICDFKTRERVVGFILIPEKQRPLAISPESHYRSDDDVTDAIVYVVQTASGQQTLTPADFEAKYGWKNDPTKVVIPKALPAGKLGVAATTPSTTSTDAAHTLRAPFNADVARQAQQAWAKSLGEPSHLKKNAVGMDLVLIPPGTFLMGSSFDERRRGDDENQMEVTLTKPFWLGACEVTQGEWETVMGNDATPKFAESERQMVGTNFPMVVMLWRDAGEFCKKLTASERKAGRLSNDWEYALPTEAQWEYACRAGTTTRFFCGDDEQTLAEFAWFASKNEDRAHPVRSKRANPFGLHDMLGNVMEYCRDAYVETLPGGIDPLMSAQPETTHCVIRGNFWGGHSNACRSAFRTTTIFSSLGYSNGFRVACVPVGNAPLLKATNASSSVSPNVTQPQSLTAPFNADAARQAQQAWAKSLGVPSPMKKTPIGMELALIPPESSRLGPVHRHTVKLPGTKTAKSSSCSSPSGWGSMKSPSDSSVSSSRRRISRRTASGGASALARSPRRRKLSQRPTPSMAGGIPVLHRPTNTRS